MFFIAETLAFGLALFLSLAPWAERGALLIDAALCSTLVLITRSAGGAGSWVFLYGSGAVAAGHALSGWGEARTFGLGRFRRRPGWVRILRRQGRGLRVTVCAASALGMLYALEIR